MESGIKETLPEGNYHILIKTKIPYEDDLFEGNDLMTGIYKGRYLTTGKGRPNTIFTYTKNYSHLEGALLEIFQRLNAHIRKDESILITENFNPDYSIYFFVI